MITDGQNDGKKGGMIMHMGVVRRDGWVIWIGLFVKTALGLHVITF